MQQGKLDDYKDLKLKLAGLVPPGHGFHRNLLFDTLYCLAAARSAGQSANL